MERMPRPARVWVADHGQGGEDQGQVRLERLEGVNVHRAGGQVGLGEPERLLNVPQIVIAVDDRVGAHLRCGDVRDVALQPGQPPGPGQAGLVQNRRVTFDLHELRRSGCFLALDDGLDPVLLGSESLRIPACAFGTVGPDRPPCSWRPQTGSALVAGLFSIVRVFFGVIVSIT